MKFKYLLSAIISFLLMTSMVNAITYTPPSAGTFTQGTGDTIVITSGIPGNLETVINSDVTSGVRNDPNRVYVLTTGMYEQNAGIAVIDSTGTISIVGKVTNVQRPVWYRNEIGGLELAANAIAGSLVIKNIDYEAVDLQGQYYAGDNGDFVISTANQRVELDNNLISYSWVSTINAQAVVKGFKFIARGNYFRNMTSATQWWYGRVLYAKVPVDTLIFENNTVSGGGLTLLEQNSLTVFAQIDHNTFINNERYCSPNPFYLEGYFTDNIFLNSNIAGEDSIDVMNSQDVDHLRTGIFQVDTLMSANLFSIDVDPQYLKSDGTKDPSKLALSNVKWYVGDNIAVQEENNAKWVNYITGASPYADGVADSAASFLTWTSKKILGPGDTLKFGTPHGVTNFKQCLVNSRGENLAKDNKNIYISKSNIEYSIPGEALKLPTVALDTEKTNFWIEFNRSSQGYGVPGVAAPVAYPGQTTANARFAWGSYNPANVPGPKVAGKYTEVPFAHAKGGITKFTDLLENFNCTEFISQIDGLQLGSQIWAATPAAIPSNELSLIKTVYANAQAGTDLPLLSGVSVETATAASSAFLTVGPNPTSGTTYVIFDLPGQSNVLTVTDISGNVVESVANVTSPYPLDASSLKNGLYIIVLKSDATVLTSKLVKQ